MDQVARLREICMRLPEVTERRSHGEPAFFVRGKRTFVMFADHHHDDRVGFWCAAPPGVQGMVVERESDVFFVPPYVGHRGWIGVRLDTGAVDWDAIARIVEEAYRVIAPARLAAQLD